MTKTHLSKQILGDYLESNCERQLFLNLGQGKNNWIHPFREVKPLERQKVPLLITKLGKMYESDVYEAIVQNNVNKVLIHPNIDSEEKEIALSPDFLELVYQKMIADGPTEELCLLEYNFETPAQFIRELFDLEPHEDIPTDYSGSLRPDILFFGNKKMEATRFSKVKFDRKEPIRELRTDGTIRVVPKDELGSRIAITIIDVKLSRPDAVGKRYFFEILFYFMAMNYFLHVHHLEDKFFIRVDGNGIFARYPDIKTHPLTIDEVRRRVVKMPFKDTYILYDSLEIKLHEFKDKIPCEIEDIPLNLQPICARCKYLEDCKKTLNYDDSIPPERWDLQVIPYTSKTISKQLKGCASPQYDTIKDVAENIEEHPQKKVPTPLYAERPFLKQRAEALLTQESCTPEVGEMYSVAVPRYSPLTLIMDFEIDPIHNVVCAVSFHFSSFLTENFPQYEKFVGWWTSWDTYLDNKRELDEITDEILERFGDRIKDQDKAAEFLEIFASALDHLVTNRDNRKVPWKRVNLRSRSGNLYSKIQLDFSMVNEDLAQEDEHLFSERVVSLLYALAIFIQNLEWFIREGDRFLNSAIFYWSQEQIDYLEEFLERNLDHLNDDPDLRGKTLYILRWFNPSESNVTHPYHYKKFFNLRTFAETTMSFPLIINYTWHELATYLSKDPVYSRIFGSRELTFYEIFWNPHFNFIDFQQWYRYIYREGAEKANLLREIKLQMVIKVKTLDKLRQVFQQYGRNYLLGYNKPKSMLEFSDYDLPEHYHNIAQIWYLFENYATAYEEFEVDCLRGMFPNYGVGKLKSAKIEGLWQVLDASNRYMNFSYEFQLLGMSSNVKIEEGDWLICVPALLRDAPRYKNHKWKVIIDTMEWDNGHWEVSTRPWSTNILENYLVELEQTLQYVDDPHLEADISKKLGHLEKKHDELKRNGETLFIDDTFYLYSPASNPWADKLEHLLTLSNYGDSWLGTALAYKWGLTSRNELLYPELFPYEGWLPEVYLYAPHLLPSFESRPGTLMTTIFPEPDDSQKNAILNAMKYTTYGIQGPPGTGKTQTITALVDEYIRRQKGQGAVKVLVVAFSYAALRVVFENISKSRDASGSLTAAAQARLVFLRSRSREPPQSSHQLYDVHKSNKNTLIIEKLEAEHEEFLGEITPDTDKKFEDVLETDENSVIVFANAHQLFSLNDLHYGSFKFIHPGFAFDLIVVDESSQVPVDHILAPLQYIKNLGINLVSSRGDAAPHKDISDLKELDDLYIVSKNDNSRLNPTQLTKLVIVGDQNQLPPVQQVKPPKKLEPILDNLFGYYADHHQIHNDQLEFNYRSHRDIVGFTNYMNIYEHDIKPLTNRDKTIEGNFKRLRKWIMGENKPKIEEWVLNVLDREKIVETILQHNKFETAVSPLEAYIVIQLVLGYYIINMPKRGEVSVKEMKQLQREFWNKKIGVVAPHNAQGRLIIRKLHQKLTVYGLNALEERELMEILKKTIYSVEKFQGSARDFIIASIGISAQDQLLSEEDFIYNLNRFNVLTSRARAKFTFICSKNFLTYIPNEKELMQTAAKIRRFALDYCNDEVELDIEFEGNKEHIIFRYRL